MTRAGLGLALLAGATSWGSADIGPVTSALAHEFDVSLASVGVVGGTVFVLGLLVAKLWSAAVTRHIGTARACQLACALALAGSVVAALAPEYWVLGVGRVVSGVGLGLAIVAGPVLAKEAGGVRLVGLFGAGVQLGVAGALAAGSVMRGAGVDWRVDFAVAAVAALLALVALALAPRSEERAEIPSGSVLALVRRAATSWSAWRIELLFTTALGVPYILGVWLVPYLTEDAHVSSELAGLLSVALYVLLAFVRPEGARLEARGLPAGALGGLAPLAAAGGLLLLALDGAVPVLIGGALLAGAGFAIPYALMYDEAQRLYPEARVAAVGLLSVGGNVLPLAVLPVLGAAIENGNGELAFAALAALPLLTGLVNLRPALTS